MAAIVCDSISLPASHINRDGILSVLPEDILQQILSSLTLKQRAIASLVCKSWHQMITSLDDRKFVRTHSTKIYCGYCYYYHNNCQCSYRVEPFIKFAADNMSFTEFYLFVRSSYYYMSTQTLESSLLTVLHLKGDCNLNFVRDIKELPSLKEIYFDSVRISPCYFSKFMNKCPSIVDLTLIRCYDLHSISVPHLNQLKKVHVNCRSRYIQTIEIKARNLLEFHLFISSSAAKEKLDLCACTKLQVLKIDSEYIPIGFPKDISLAFPCLKSLSLPLCKGLNKIKSLRLIDRVDVDDAFIVSPNLRSFKLIDIKKVPSLRTFAENLGENISLSLEADTTESKEVKFHSGNHQSNIQPLCIKHINLAILFSSVSRYESLLDELFSYFHPRTVLVRMNSDALKHNFIQVLLNELKGRDKECTKRYKYINYMSWRYFLKGYEILESTTITRKGAHQISLEFQWFK